MAAAIITGAFAVLGALGGVWITQHYTFAMERKRRSEALSDQYRRVISEVLATGFAKVEMYRPALPLFAKYKSTSEEEWQALLKDEADERFIRTNTEFARAASQAAMLAGEQEMLGRLATVRQLDRTFTENVVTLAMQGRVESAQNNLTAFRTALMELEGAAATLLRVTTRPPRPRWRLSRRRRWDTDLR